MIGTKLYKPIQDTFLTVEKVVTDTFTETVQVPDETSETGFRNEEVTRTEERIEYERVKNPAPNTREKYAQMAGWCNRNNARIVDKGSYYEVEAIPAPTAEEQAEIDLNEAKQVRAEAVEAITSTVDGNIFEGDEVSQGRMARAVVFAMVKAEMVNNARRLAYEQAIAGLTPEEAEAVPKPIYDNYLDYTIPWVTGNNQVIETTIGQLGTAGGESMLIQAGLWTVPYES